MTDMADIIYIEEIVDAYDEARRTAWILDGRMDDYGEQAREAYEQAQRELDRLMEAYAFQEGVEDIHALRKAFHAYICRQREIDEVQRRRSDDNLQRFYREIDDLSDDGETPEEED